MNRNAAADQTWRRRIIRSIDLNMSVPVDAPVDDAVILEAVWRQRQQRRSLLLKHLAHLALCRAVDARKCPAFVPSHQQIILLIDALESASLQCGRLRVTDRRFNFPLEIGSIRSTGNGDDAVMGEHRGIKRVDFPGRRRRDRRRPRADCRAESSSARHQSTRTLLHAARTTFVANCAKPSCETRGGSSPASSRRAAVCGICRCVRLLWERLRRSRLAPLRRAPSRNGSSLWNPTGGSDEQSVLPHHMSLCMRGARQDLDKLQPRCGRSPIRLRRIRHAHERLLRLGGAGRVVVTAAGKFSVSEESVGTLPEVCGFDGERGSKSPASWPRRRIVSCRWPVSRATRRMLQRKRSRPRIDSRSDALNSFMAALSRSHPKRTRAIRPEAPFPSARRQACGFESAHRPVCGFQVPAVCGFDCPPRRSVRLDGSMNPRSFLEAEPTTDRRRPKSVFNDSQCSKNVSVGDVTVAE